MRPELQASTASSTSNSLHLPGIPSDFIEGETARQIDFSLLSRSATTRFVSRGSNPRSLHSTEA